MKQLLGLIIAVTLLNAASAGADNQSSTLYLSPDELDTTHFIGPPPPEKVTRREIDLILRLQAERTQQLAERSVADLEQSVFRFADVMGPDFTAEKLPFSAAFFEEIYRTESAFNLQGKELWKRPRPPVLDERIKPVAKYSHSGSYPSGHAAFAFLTAIVLADIVPEKRELIFTRATEFGDNRVLGGVHYPSDVEAGRRMAVAIAVLMYRNPGFRKDLETARTEIRAALGLSR